MRNFDRKMPYFNIKHINEVSAWTIAGFTYFAHEEPDEIIENGNTRTKKFVMEETGTEVFVKETFYEGIKAVRQENTVIKTNDKKIVLSQFSSCLLNGIEFDDYNDITVHYTNFAWQTEGQWKKASLYDLGLQPGGNHGIVCVKKFSGKGTFSTDSHYPMVMVENTKTNTIYFLELEVSSSWYIELGIKSVDNKKCVYIEANNSFLQNDGWYLDMKKGESYISAPAVWGAVEGGFNDAVNELLKYKRKTSLRHFEGDIPVVFNNYMNSIWCEQTSEKIIPLVNSAKDAGVDIFCMDAGWYDCIGDWNIKEENFGDMKLQGVIDHIKSLGMTAGIWLEAEACTSEAQSYNDFYEAVYKSHGIPIGGERVLMDFRCKKFYTFMKEVVDKLYRMGIRYIKNDFNKNSGMDIDGDKGGSRELREASLAFYSFINDINEQYPDLIIENCGSGAMRSDGAMLRYFSMQSTSDLEYYQYYPSVMTGMNACIPLEKSGVWSYPYPHFYEQRNTDDIEYFTDEYINERKDGKETVFNMVTSMFGCMYLSGRIDKCDEYNFSLIKEAIEAYKTFSGDIKNSYPVFFEYPVNTSDSYTTSFGMYNPENKTMILGLWNYNGNRNYSVDMGKYLTKNSHAEILYPKNSNIKHSIKDNKLDILFDDDISAGVIKIKL